MKFGRAAGALLLGIVASASGADSLTISAAHVVSKTVRFAQGDKARVSVDFAAGGCVWSGETVRRLHLPMVGSGATRKALARDVTMDGFLLGDLACSVGHENVVGGDAFRALVVRVDAAGRLSLYGGAQHGRELAGPAAHLIHVAQTPDGRLTIPVRLNGAPGLGLIDLESPVSSINDVFRARAGAKREAPDVLDLAGFTIAVAPAVQEAAVSDHEDRPVIRLGRDALGGFSLVLDYPFARVWIDPPS